MTVVASNPGMCPGRCRVGGFSIRGFSLIELMVVVVVIGILAAIGFPSYQDYVRRGNRSSAQQLMLEIASKEGQYIIDARQYTATVGSGGLNIPNRDGWTCTTASTTPQCSNSYYTLAVTVDNAATPPSYSMTATAIGTQVADGNLTLNSLGTKTRLVSSVDKGW
jgi:type IV pilus assembly protein PilE